jgi:hypothetical protein
MGFIGFRQLRKERLVRSHRYYPKKLPSPTPVLGVFLLNKAMRQYSFNEYAKLSEKNRTWFRIKQHVVLGMPYLYHSLNKFTPGIMPVAV